MRLFMTTALTLIALVGAGRAQDGPCPDQKATNVDARSANVGDKERCGIGFVLFGQEISFFGPSCYDFVFLYPAFQECKGETLSDHKCVVEGKIAIRVFDCDCASLNIPVLETGIAMPDCDCVDIGGIGHVEDFQTVECK